MFIEPWQGKKQGLKIFSYLQIIILNYVRRPLVKSHNEKILLA